MGRVGDEGANVRRGVRGGGGGGAVVRAAAGGSSSATHAAGNDPTSSPARGEGLAELPVVTIVECAMLAALTGLIFHLSTLFRVDAWFGALFPMPVVIAAARHGNAAARRVMFTASLLLFVISGEEDTEPNPDSCSCNSHPWQALL